MGIRRIVLKMPFWPRIFQKGMLFLRPLITGFDRGILYFPRDRNFFGLLIWAEERSGRYVLGFRLKKSNILCFAGWHPVINDDHATGEMAGIVVPSLLYVPDFLSFDRLGSLPSSRYFSTRVGSIPSSPTMTTWLTELFL